MIFDDSDRKADKRIEQILEIIKDNDGEALKLLFSKQSLSEAKDIDGQIDYLFDFFQGDIESWERTGFSSETSKNYGKESIKLISSYTVVTDKDKYSFIIRDYTKDTIKPDNTGLYALCVIKADEEEAYYNNGQEMEAGIYKPE
jgi:hypothetical protein